MRDVLPFFVDCRLISNVRVSDGTVDSSNRCVCVVSSGATYTECSYGERLLVEQLGCHQITSDVLACKGEII